MRGDQKKLKWSACGVGVCCLAAVLAASRFMYTWGVLLSLGLVLGAFFWAAWALEANSCLRVMHGTLVVFHAALAIVWGCPELVTCPWQAVGLCATWVLYVWLVLPVDVLAHIAVACMRWVQAGPAALAISSCGETADERRHLCMTVTAAAAAA